jgi:hypothetical protein
MPRRLLVVIVLAALAGCDSKTPAVPTVPSPTPIAPEPVVEVASVTITGENKFIALNNVRQFKATAQMSDGSVRDVTTQADWYSNDTNVATVSATGAVTSVGAGVVAISATYTVSGTIDVWVALTTTSAISGLYRLELTAAPECSALPDWAKRREYDVTIVQIGAEQPGVESGLTLFAHAEPGFVPVFNGSIRGSTVRFEFPGSIGGGYSYYYGSFQIWPVFSHRIDNTRMYALFGAASGTKGASPNVQIAGELNGDIAAANGSTNALLGECVSANHRFTLTRQ